MTFSSFCVLVVRASFGGVSVGVSWFPVGFRTVVLDFGFSVEVEET